MNCVKQTKKKKTLKGFLILIVILGLGKINLYAAATIVTIEEDQKKIALPCQSRAEDKTLALKLVEAAQKGNQSQVETLIQLGAKADDHDGYIALIDAVYNGHKKIVKFLILSGANIDAFDEHGTTALMLAALWGHVDAIKLLIDVGADLNKTDANGEKAIDYARKARPVKSEQSTQDKVEVIKLLQTKIPHDLLRSDSWCIIC